MTEPVPPTPPPSLPTTPAGNFTNPAFVLALIPTISFILTTFFHGDLGLSKNSQQWSIIASGMVALGAYLSRAVKHHANGKVVEAWFDYLSKQSPPVVDNAPDPTTVDPADNGTDVPPPLPPLESVAEPSKRTPVKKTTAKKTTRRSG